jgi:uncharacterized membrane protein
MGKIMTNLYLLFVTSIVFILIDSTYLYLAKDFFKFQVKSIQGVSMTIRPYATILCYISLVFLLYYFILRERKSVKDAFLLGLGIYAVYETTNLAIFNRWLPITAVVDTLWGGILFALTTKVVYVLTLVMPR